MHNTITRNAMNRTISTVIKPCTFYFLICRIFSYNKRKDTMYNRIFFHYKELMFMNVFF